MMGRSIAAQRKMSDEPALLAVLPQAIGSDWTLRKDRIGYFRSHLVLNSLYYLSHQNIFHLGHSTEAVISPYEQRSNTRSPKRVQVLFVKYTTAEQAQKALDSFHTAYLHEHPKGFDPGATSKHTNFFSIEDGWLGYALSENALCVVFECPNQECARLFIKHISGNFINKENEGGK